jgi:hypothetical protein
VINSVLSVRFLPQEVTNSVPEGRPRGAIHVAIVTTWQNVEENGPIS